MNNDASVKAVAHFSTFCQHTFEMTQPGKGLSGALPFSIIRKACDYTVISSTINLDHPKMKGHPSV